MIVLNNNKGGFPVHLLWLWRKSRRLKETVKDQDGVSRTQNMCVRKQTFSTMLPHQWLQSSSRLWSIACLLIHHLKHMKIEFHELQPNFLISNPIPYRDLVWLYILLQYSQGIYAVQLWLFKKKVSVTDLQYLIFLYNSDWSMNLKPCPCCLIFC